MKHQIIRCAWLLTITSLISVSNAFAALPPDAQMILDLRRSEFSQVEVSPSGKYISAMLRRDDRNTLVILDRKTGEINGVPTTAFEQQEFIITGENIHGKNDYTFWLQINPEVKMVEVEKEVVLDDEEIYVSDDEELGLYDSLIDYKVAIRSNAHTVQTCLDRLNKSQTTEQMRKELLAAKKAIEQMLETIEE